MSKPAVFDACVLFPPTIRDILMQFAVAGLCRAHWTDRIQDEWLENLLEERPGLSREKLERTRSQMDEAIPGALVTGYELLSPTPPLPDPDDQHVLAAALHAEATGIVTSNLKDFPASHLAPHGITAVGPDDFIASLIRERPVESCAALSEIRKRLKSPPHSPESYLANLRKKGLPMAADELEKHKESI